MVAPPIYGAFREGGGEAERERRVHVGGNVRAHQYAALDAQGLGDQLGNQLRAFRGYPDAFRQADGVGAGVHTVQELQRLHTRVHVFVRHAKHEQISALYTRPQVRGRHDVGFQDLAREVLRSGRRTSVSARARAAAAPWGKEGKLSLGKGPRPTLTFSCRWLKTSTSDTVSPVSLGTSSGNIHIEISSSKTAGFSRTFEATMWAAAQALAVPGGQLGHPTNKTATDLTTPRSR